MLILMAWFLCAGNIVNANKLIEILRMLNFLSLKHSNLLTTNVPHHIEASQLICSANQLTGFHMMGNTGR